jgi:hypothetical protein
MPMLRQTRARGGYSLVELALAVGMLGFGMLSFGATQMESFAQSAEGCEYRGAVQIARGQLELVQILPWDRLVPTDGFSAPPWIDVPGYFPGELPAYACAGASSLTGGRSYRVVWDKDLEYRTVTIGRNVYHPTDRTALVDRGGERVAFVRLPVARDATGRLNSFTRAVVEFTADERRGRLFLETLRLLDPPR